MDIFHPEQWHDFFLLVGTGAATLTGLIFIALTIHLRTITQDMVHRGRALSSLNGLVVIFLQCSFILLPQQKHTIIGFELLLLALVGFAVFFISGHISGLYIAAIGILATLFFIVTGAWILVVGPAAKS
jgi:hypothetical protein